MIIYIYGNRVKIKEFGHVIAEISLAQLEELTGSRKLMNIIKKRNNCDLTLRRSRNSLEIMDEWFKEFEEYILVKTGKKYRCIKSDKSISEAVMRPLSKRGKNNLLLVTETDEWIIDK